MPTIGIIGIIAFYILYATAFCVFKRGSMSKPAYLPCFIIGNIFGASATAVLMLLYGVMNPNLAMGLTLGGGFVIAQLIIALVFKNKLSFIQIGGAFVVAAGMFLLVLGGS